MQAPASRRRLFALSGGLALATLGLDQLTKWWVTSTIAPGASAPLLGAVVRLSRVHNTGAAFGLLPVNWVLVIIGLAFCLGVPFLLWWRRDITSYQGVLLALIWGGSAGNVLDRLRTGAVIDFIDVRIWPVFNVADIAITVGFLLFALQLLQRRS